MNIRIGVFVLADLILIVLSLCALSIVWYVFLRDGSDTMGYGAAAILVGWWIVAPVLCLASVVLAALVRWRGERLQKWERIAANLIAAAGWIPGLLLLGFHFWSLLK